ncbi:rhodanese-like domain-containing protein [Roseovarius sp. Pro17]|uniref:rhodanese-like domain-containing protein n=1 Tax=Roseovarius sp. Pro17 TaxID=3108175 RepID=UPI002D79CBD8|nr:rhodanese-like domain-containing protein [Roseovarius sp. Pro17]
MSAASITVAATRAALKDGGELALIDLREVGQFGEGHPFFAVNIPFSRLEADAPRLMPRRSVRCILVDDGDGIADRGAEILTEMGYSDLHVMEGGAPGWGAAGHTLFKGVNLPSKTFGELVEHQLKTPSVSAEELHAMQGAGGDFLILDGRSGPEFAKMSIPGAQSCPNAELGYRVGQMALAGTPIVVNCAGRTRSIIGAETLRLAGWTGPVHALRNGTQGWRLAGYELDHGREAGELPPVPPQGLNAARAKAQELIASYDIPLADMATIQRWMGDDTRTIFRFDVRTEAEHRAGHAPGFASAPGGQLVQATDEKLAVRGARIVLSCDTGLRAATTAIWLMGMGHSVWVLRGAALSEKNAPQPTADRPDLSKLIANSATLLDASNGMDYRASHIEGAVWANRAHLHRDRPDLRGPITIVGQDAALLEGVRQELMAQGHDDIKAVASGPEDWQAAGLKIVQTPDNPSEAECIDHLFFVHDRHDDNLDAARRYLEWETGLLSQLDPDERAALKPLTPGA